MFYRLMLVLTAVTVIGHCGKVHHGKTAKPATTITAPQNAADEQDAA